MASLVRWSPFGDLISLPREMERVFDWTLPRMALESEGRMLVPTMDVLYRDDDMIVRLELPGMKESEIEIGVSNDALSISGEHEEEHVLEHEDYILKESSAGRFERQVALPKGIDPKTIRAEFADGVLQVVVPKAKALEEPKTHRIPIGTGAGHKH